MPVEVEMAPVDQQIRCYGQFISPSRSQQGAVISDAQAETAFLAEAGSASSSLANLREQG
jgi:hypothetical protein